MGDSFWEKMERMNFSTILVHFPANYRPYFWQIWKKKMKECKLDKWWKGWLKTMEEWKKLILRKNGEVWKKVIFLKFLIVSEKMAEHSEDWGEKMEKIDFFQFYLINVWFTVLYKWLSLFLWMVQNYFLRMVQNFFIQLFPNFF